MDQTQCFPELMQHLPSGCLLVTGKDKPNIMTMGWCTVGVMWGKQVLMAPVRLSRYSHALLEACPEFSVCVPDGKQLAKALALAGSKSGRDLDKVKEAGLTLAPSQTISVPYVAECPTVYECRTVYRLDMSPEHLEPAIQEHCYPNGDYHTLFFGEILACRTR